MKRTKYIPSGIYQIRNIIDGKRYIGSSINVKTRMKDHRNQLLRVGHSNIHLQRAWNKYGEESFVFEIVQRCQKEDLLFSEQSEINKYPFNTLYNLIITAERGVGFTHCKETREKLSKAGMGRIAWNKGIPMREDSKAKFCRKGKTPWNKGIKCGPSWNKGKKATLEMRKTLSEAHKGYITPESQKRKQSETLKKHYETHIHASLGFKHSEESKKAIAGYQKGTIRSEETKRRMSEAKRKYWADKKKVA